MDEAISPGPDDLDRALGLAFGPPRWSEGGGVLPRLEQSTGLRLRTSLPPPAGQAELERSPPSDVDPAEDVRFEVLGEVARGGVGVVYHGRDRDLRREVALKVLKPDLAGHREVVVRFVEEAQVCGQLAHPGIVPVYGLGPLEDGRPSIAMKLVRGATLADVLATLPDRGAELPRLLGLFEQLASTVGYAHARGVIHRDLKPANVMVGAFGELQVMDWGFAKVLDSASDREEVRDLPITTVRSVGGEAPSLVGTIMGTPGYLSPEQARGHVSSVDARTDVFALGAILCEILTGRPAYAGPAAGRLSQAIGADLDEAYERLEASGADPPLIALARKCLARDAEARPPDARSVAEAVRTYREAVRARAEEAEIQRASAAARELEARSRAGWERRARRQVRRIAGAVAVALLLGAGTWFWLRHEVERRADAAVSAAELALAEAEEDAARGDLVAAIGSARRAVEQMEPYDDRPAASRARQVEARLRRRLEAEERTRRRAAEDADVVRRLATAPEPGAGVLSRAQREAAWERTFAGAGLDVEAGSTADAASWIRGRGDEARKALLGGLDAWGALRRAGGDAAGAERLQEIVLGSDPDPWRCRMRKQVASGDASGVIETALELLEEDAPASESVRLAGRALGGLAPDARVVAALRRMRERFPQDPDVQLALAASLRGGARPERQEAERCLASAVSVAPRRGDAWSALGAALAADGRAEDAEAAWRAGTVEAPQSELPSLALARHLVRASRIGDAAALLEARIARSAEQEGHVADATLRVWLADEDLAALRDARPDLVAGLRRVLDDAGKGTGR